MYYGNLYIQPSATPADETRYHIIVLNYKQLLHTATEYIAFVLESLRIRALVS